MKFKRLFALNLILVVIISTLISSGTEVTQVQTSEYDIKNSPEYIEPISDIGKYKLNESVGDLTLWTDFVSEKIFKDTEIPTETSSSIQVYMAKNEFEPFQIVLNSATKSNAKIQINNENQGIDVELHKVMYIDLKESTDNLGRTGLYPDPLYPIGEGEVIELEQMVNQPIWVTLHTKGTIEAGDYNLTVLINEVAVPIKVHVFNFSIPKELHVKSQINVSTKRVLDKYGVTGTHENYWKYVDSFKQFMIDHRLTPKSALWSGGLTSRGGSPYIDYNSTSGQLSDPHGIWGFEYPAKRYLDGLINNENKYLGQTYFNDGVGFPSFMAMTFRNNDASSDQRPDVFDGTRRTTTDWYTSNNSNSLYNRKWFNYVGHIETYLRNNGYLDKAYYYFANEPQDQADYDAVSWYSQELKKAAPNLRLMVSEEPKPEIYNNARYPGAKIDQWLPVLNKYNPDVSWDREANHNEETWIYFLYGTKPPYFNPITLDHPGIESKLTGWFLWKYRLKGIAHYAFNNWSKNVWENPMTSGHNGDDFMLYPPNRNNAPIEFGATNHRFVSSIRFELMRDSLEDYEYLYMLNNQQNPKVYEVNRADNEVDKIIYGLTSYNRSSQYMYNLRSNIGLLIENKIAAIPLIETSDQHMRATDTQKAYYINFQDPNGSPTNNPLVINGKEFMKIGWNSYDENLGYGWYGDMNHVMYRSVHNAPDLLKGSVIFDDWGREKTFEFDLPNGKYNVTICCGWQGRTYKRNKIRIEGVSFINDEATAPYLVRSQIVEVKDNKLTMEMGIFDEYTMLNYLEIEPIN